MCLVAWIKNADDTLCVFITALEQHLSAVSVL